MSPKKKKTYLAIVGVMGSGLIVDRFMLADSATAPQAAEAIPLDVVNGLNDTDALTKTQIPGVPFPKNIPTFGSGFVLRDVFVKPGGSHDPSDNTARTGAGLRKIALPQNLTREEFAEAHTLTAVFSDQGVEIAVVDEKWLRVGQSITGCELTGVEGEKARFQCRDGESSLEISDPIQGH